MMTDAKKIRVKLVRSIYGRKPGHAACAQGLGLKKIHQVKEVLDTPCNRGMINKIDYLLKIEEIL